MVVPYVLAHSLISQEAIKDLPEELRGWEIVYYTDEVLEELGRRWLDEPGPMGLRDGQLARDPGIVWLAFMNRDPGGCVGWIADTADLHSRPKRSEVITQGDSLACFIVAWGYRGSYYMGHWAHVAKRWVDHRQGHTWK